MRQRRGRYEEKKTVFHFRCVYCSLPVKFQNSTPRKSQFFRNLTSCGTFSWYERVTTDAGVRKDMVYPTTHILVLMTRPRFILLSKHGTEEKLLGDDEPPVPMQIDGLCTSPREVCSFLLCSGKPKRGSQTDWSQRSVLTIPLKVHNHIVAFRSH